jgi:hypothetical protein
MSKAAQATRDQDGFRARRRALDAYQLPPLPLRLALIGP